MVVGTIYIPFRLSGKIILKSMRMTLDFFKHCEMTATRLMDWDGNENCQKKKKERKKKIGTAET